MHTVCAQHGRWYRRYRNIPEGESPLLASWRSPLVSRNVVCREFRKAMEQNQNGWRGSCPGLFSAQRSQWRDWQRMSMNPCFPITKKYLHNLMNRCIRGCLACPEESRGTVVIPTQKLRQIKVRGAPL
jgi:hypothetical protein